MPTARRRNATNEMLKSGHWQRSNHSQHYGSAYRRHKEMSWWATPDLKALVRRSYRPDLDIYQFGVYTGRTMHSISKTVGAFRHMWGL